MIRIIFSGVYIEVPALTNASCQLNILNLKSFTRQDPGTAMSLKLLLIFGVLRLSQAYSMWNPTLDPKHKTLNPKTLKP